MAKRGRPKKILTPETKKVEVSKVEDSSCMTRIALNQLQHADHLTQLDKAVNHLMGGMQELVKTSNDANAALQKHIQVLEIEASCMKEALKSKVDSEPLSPADIEGNGKDSLGKLD